MGCLHKAMILKQWGIREGGRMDGEGGGEKGEQQKVTEHFQVQRSKQRLFIKAFKSHQQIRAGICP